jgi:hypothetical protein
LWAWGNNEYGQLGLGDKVDRLVPTQVGSSTDWGYPTTYSASGSISGIKLNAGSGNFASWVAINWSSVALPANTSIKFRARTSSDNITYSAWSDYFTQSTLGSTTGTGDLSAAGLADSQYLEIEVTLTTSNSLVTPTLNDFSVTYSVTPLPTPVVASGGGLPAVAFTPIQIPQTGFKVSINQDATTTTSNQVLLSLTPGPDTTQMAISNLPDFPGVGIEPFTSTKSWLLSLEPGLKTVYVKFYNAWGQASQVVSDSILLSSATTPNQNPSPANLTTGLNSSASNPAPGLSFPFTPPANPATPLFTLTLKLNSKGSQVLLLQNLLQAQGFFPSTITPNGYFGPTTLKAVKAFQIKYNLAKPGLAGYGQVGPATRAVLNQLGR